jgi:hypothetical protein
MHRRRTTGSGRSFRHLPHGFGRLAPVSGYAEYLLSLDHGASEPLGRDHLFDDLRLVGSGAAEHNLFNAANRFKKSRDDGLPSNGVRFGVRSY